MKHILTSIFAALLLAPLAIILELRVQTTASCTALTSR